MEKAEEINSYSVMDDKNRIDYIDALRTFACFAVIMLHITALNTYYVDFQSHDWAVFMLYESIVNWSVPVFVMLSGAVLLNKEYSYKKIFQKCKSLVFIFITWSIIYLLFDFINYGFSTYENMLWLQVILQGHYHMWYLIMLFGLYLLIPLIKLIVEKPVLAKTFIFLSIVFTFLLPTIKDLSLVSFIQEILKNSVIGALYRAVCNIIDDLNFHFTVGFVAYFVIGYMISHGHDKKNNYTFPLGLVLLLIGSFIVFCEIKYAISKDAAKSFMQYYQLGIFMQSVGLFICAKEFSGKRVLRLISRISPLTFGIFLLHPMIIEILQKQGITSLSFSPMIAVPVLSLYVFVLSGFIVFIMMKTPCKKILGLRRDSLL